jgi:c-di-AMP phosphodiesterase-like protein
MITKQASKTLLPLSSLEAAFIIVRSSEGIGKSMTSIGTLKPAVKAGSIPEPIT